MVKKDMKAQTNKRLRKGQKSDRSQKKRHGVRRTWNSRPQHVPDLWRESPRLGRVVPGTCILPFKVPLSKRYKDQLSKAERWTPKIFLDTQKEKGFNVQLVVDLTNTTRYYNGPTELGQFSCRYVKIPIEGFDQYPEDELVDRFIKVVNEFEKENPEAHAAVHCTHGLNRTGFLVVTYLVKEKGMSVSEALKAFQDARSPGLIKTAYIEELHRRYGTQEEKVQYPKLPKWAEAKYGPNSKPKEKPVVRKEKRRAESQESRKKGFKRKKDTKKVPSSPAQ